MTTQPACSVIVPSYCSSHTIHATLAALAEQDLPARYEIIVVDSSPDGTPALIRRAFPQVCLIHLPQRADPARARNVGAQRARGGVLAFIDADCVADRDWLRRLCETLAQGYDAVGGSIANGNGETPVSWAGYMCEFREFLPHGAPRDAANLTLGNAAYRHTVFWAAGGLPEGWFPQEDQVFHATLCRQGRRMRFDPQIVVWHAQRTRRTAFLEHQRLIGQANARVLRRLRLPGSALIDRPWLAQLAVPALVLLRFLRTTCACLGVDRARVLRQPRLAWLCFLGMCWWGRGLVEAAQVRPEMQGGAAWSYESPTWS